jgi:hypothetical protein
MAGKTITAGNVQFSLSIPDLGIGPVVLEGYAADDIFDVPSVSKTETVDGVDGNMSHGWVYSSTKMDIHIMPDSPSAAVFQQWAQAMDQRRDSVAGVATVIYPGLGATFSLSKVVLKDAPPMSSLKKVAQKLSYTLQIGNIAVTAN